MPLAQVSCHLNELVKSDFSTLITTHIQQIHIHVYIKDKYRGTKVGGAETPVNGKKDGAWRLLARWRRLNKLLADPMTARNNFWPLCRRQSSSFATLLAEGLMGDWGLGSSSSSSTSPSPSPHPLTCRTRGCPRRSDYPAAPANSSRGDRWWPGPCRVRCANGRASSASPNQCRARSCKNEGKRGF